MTWGQMRPRVMKMANPILGTLMGVCFLLALLLFCLIGRVGTNKTLYHSQQVVLDVAANVGLNQEQLDHVTGVLIDYLRGKNDDMQVVVEVDGTTQYVYTERELAHMVDVQQLFSWATNLQAWATIAGALLGFAIWLLNGEEWFGVFCKGFIQGAVVGLGFVMLVIFIAAFDFDAAFTQFHHIFFDNDLWMMYETDFLIRIMPLEFFMAMAVRVAVWFLGLLAVAAAVVWSVWQRWKIGGFRFTVRAKNVPQTQKKAVPKKSSGKRRKR